METVDLTHAKDHLAELLERAIRGEDVRISDAAIGTVKLMVVEALLSSPERRPGRWKGRLNIPDEKLLETLRVYWREQRPGRCAERPGPPWDRMAPAASSGAPLPWPRLTPIIIIMSGRGEQAGADCERRRPAYARMKGDEGDGWLERDGHHWWWQGLSASGWSWRSSWPRAPRVIRRQAVHRVRRPAPVTAPSCT